MKREGRKIPSPQAEKVAAGGASTALNANTVLPPDDGRGGESTTALHRWMTEKAIVAIKNILITFLQ